MDGIEDQTSTAEGPLALTQGPDRERGETGEGGNRWRALEAAEVATSKSRCACQKARDVSRRAIDRAIESCNGGVRAVNQQRHQQQLQQQLQLLVRFLLLQPRETG